MDASSKSTISPSGAAAADGVPYRVAIVHPGDREARLHPAPESGRFAPLFKALEGLGARTQDAAYHDDFCDEVRRQLMQVDAVLVWVNPIEGGRDRSILDAMLREVSAAGVFVSAHPDVILKLGTKEVLYRTRDLGWGCDTHVYRSLEQMRRELPARLAGGKIRVLKQYRGNGGNGVWKVQLADHAGVDSASEKTALLVRHAKRGCFEESISLADFLERCTEYFSGTGKMIEQEYQARLPEGMVRCYLVHDKVAGFGHQAVNALYPAPPGAPPEAAPQAGPRLYHPPTMPQFQALKHQLEQVWVPAMQRLLEIDTIQLPVIWDCDFMFGPKDQSGQDTFVLCEINVSSVSPFPDSAIAPVAEAAIARAAAARRRQTTASR